MDYKATGPLAVSSFFCVISCLFLLVLALFVTLQQSLCSHSFHSLNRQMTVSHYMISAQ